MHRILPVVAVLALTTACAPAPADPDSRTTAFATASLAPFDDAQAPGAAVLVARGDTVLFRGAAGIADGRDGTELKPEAAFRIGSITKQFTAVGLLLLAEDGQLSLDDPLSRFLPDYPGGADIRLRDLLNHTAGVPNYTELPAWQRGPFDTPVTTAQAVAVFANETPAAPAGTRWAYSNSGYVLAGAVIEDVTGQPWHAFLQQRLFVPLGMTHTRFAADAPATRETVAGHTRDGNALVPVPAFHPSRAHAAGGLVSTVDDLFKRNRVLHEGRVLKPDSYRQMVTPEGAARGAHYGFGIEQQTVQGQPMLSHGGDIPGFAGVLDYVPGADVTVVVLENSDGNDEAQSPAVLARRLAASALGRPYPEARAVRIDKGALSALEGVYRSDPDTARVLRVVDDTLTAQRIGSGRFPLMAIGSDDFLYADGLNRLHIARDASGNPTGLRYLADGEGPGLDMPRSREPLPTAHEEVPLRQWELDRLLGRYAAADQTLVIAFEGRRLMAQVGRERPVEIFAESANAFFTPTSEDTFDFTPGSGEAAAVTLRRNGEAIAFQRQ